MAKKMSGDMVKECLSGVSYPADKEALIKHAQKTCGNNEVVSMLKNLPDRSYGESKMLISELRGIVPGINVDIL